MINAIVNAELESRTGVFAAGDCTSFHDISLGRRRIEHYDHASNSGRIAGLNMTGLRKPYVHQPMFWSNVGNEIQFEAVGILDSKLKTVSVWDKDGETEEKSYEKGIVYYLKDEKVCGILFWNSFGKIDKARDIILSKKRITKPSELMKYFN